MLDSTGRCTHDNHLHQYQRHLLRTREGTRLVHNRRPRQPDKFDAVGVHPRHLGLDRLAQERFLLGDDRSHVLGDEIFGVASVRTAFDCPARCRLSAWLNVKTQEITYAMPFSSRLLLGVGGWTAYTSILHQTRNGQIADVVVVRWRWLGREERKERSIGDGGRIYELAATNTPASTFELQRESTFGIPLPVEAT